MGAGRLREPGEDVILRLHFGRWLALMCAVLVWAGTVHSAHAMAETCLHSNQIPHAADELAATAHDDVAGQDHRTHGHDEAGGSSERGHHDGVAHHHHADHGVDSIDVVDSGANPILRSDELIGASLDNAPVTTSSDGIERPPRL
jgi:hypothetical protein